MRDMTIGDGRKENLWDDSLDVKEKMAVLVNKWNVIQISKSSWGDNVRDYMDVDGESSMAIPISSRSRCRGD